MEPIVIVLLVVVALVVVGGGALLLRRGKRIYQRQEGYDRAAKAANAPQDPLKETHIDAHDPTNIQVGYTVEYLQQMWTVRGTVNLADGSYKWKEHFLETADGRRVYFSVEEDPDLEIHFWEEIHADLVPGADTLVYDGDTYRYKEKGSASYTSVGTTGMPNGSGRVKYYDYKGPGGKWLGFEQVDGGDWEVSAGQEVDLRLLRVYPTNLQV